MDITVREINDNKRCIVLKTSEFNSTKLVASNFTRLQNIDWYIVVWNNKGALDCYLDAAGNNNIFKATVKTDFRLLKNDGTVATSDSRKFKMSPMNYYGPALWIDDFSKYSSDCISDGKITIECEFEILEISGNYPGRSINFKESNTLSNTTLMVGEETFYANKQILSIQSPVFEKLLNCDDDSEEIINLKDVSPTYFTKFLHLLYNRDVHLNNHSTQGMLILAERFETPVVTQKCEQCLLDEFFTLEEKKMYAEKYGLKDLAKQCEKLEKKANMTIFSNLISYISDKLSYL